jgi:hypothetical protein
VDNQSSNSLINRAIIESRFGDRSFILVEGDLLKDDGDLIVVNTYRNDDGEVTGDFADVIATKLEMADAFERPIFFLENGGTINLIQGENKSSQKLLVIHTNLKEGQPISAELYAEMIRGLFSAIVALEVAGYRFSNISFPVLFRKGIGSIYNEAAKTLIKYAVQWLKQSNYTNSIRYFVYIGNEVVQWNEAIERSLGRSVVNAAVDEEVSRLRLYLLGLISSFPREQAVYQDTLVPLQNALNREMISPEVVAAFGRKLAESLCETITGNTEASFNANLSAMKHSGKHDLFFIQNLYQMKAYGNTSVHRSNPIYGTDKLSSDDLKILLLILKDILGEYERNILGGLDV